VHEAAELVDQEPGSVPNEPPVQKRCVVEAYAAATQSSASESFNRVLQSLRSGTWAPPAYLLPLGMAVLLWTRRPTRAAMAMFAAGTILAAIGLFVLFQWLPRYAPMHWLGIVRPTLLLVPLLWIPVGIALWRRRHVDRISHALAFYALGIALSHCFMLYSDQATSKFAMTAHFGVFGTPFGAPFGVFGAVVLLQIADNNFHPFYF